MVSYFGDQTTLSDICHINPMNTADIKLSKKKQRKFINHPSQSPFYYYSIVLKDTVWKKILDHEDIVEVLAAQIQDKRISAPQVIDLSWNHWIIYLSDFNGCLFYGLHRFDFNKREIITGSGMNLTCAEFTQLCEYLRQKKGQKEELIVKHTLYQWQWCCDKEMVTADTWFPTEVLCMQAALAKKPGDSWTLEINTRPVEHEFNERFLDVISAELIRQKIKYLSNTVQYYLSENGDPTPAEVDMYGAEALNSINKTDLLEMTLNILKKCRYISTDESIHVMKKIVSYQSKFDILTQLKSGKFSADLTHIICL